jgi:hypothetical protein
MATKRIGIGLSGSDIEHITLITDGHNRCRFLPLASTRTGRWGYLRGVPGSLLSCEMGRLATVSPTAPLLINFQVLSGARPSVKRYTRTQQIMCPFRGHLRLEIGAASYDRPRGMAFNEICTSPPTTPLNHWACDGTQPRSEMGTHAKMRDRIICLKSGYDIQQL